MKLISRVGKGALFAPRPRGPDDGGHTSLCPPYKSGGNKRPPAIIQRGWRKGGRISGGFC
jgi:hypothetical protein